jgi:methylglutaconyl-CoA hydratase
LFLTGEVFDAQRALRIGLVNAVVEDLDGTVDRYLQALLLGGPSALTGTKKLLQAGLDDSDERYAALLAMSAAQFDSAEAREGAASFTGKRPAAWVRN